MGEYDLSNEFTEPYTFQVNHHSSPEYRTVQKCRHYTLLSFGLGQNWDKIFRILRPQEIQMHHFVESVWKGRVGGWRRNSTVDDNLYFLCGLMDTCII
jgi:hypothetical protein